MIEPAGGRASGDPVELTIGRSAQVAVMLTGMRASTTGIAMTLSVRSRVRMRRFDLNDKVFDGLYCHDQDEAWRRDHLKWGFEFADGRRATNVDPWLNPSESQTTPPSCAVGRRRER